MVFTNNITQRITLFMQHAYSCEGGGPRHSFGNFIMYNNITPTPHPLRSTHATLMRATLQEKGNYSFYF